MTEEKDTRKLIPAREVFARLRKNPEYQAVREEMKPELDEFDRICRASYEAQLAREEKKRKRTAAIPVDVETATA